MNAIASSGQCSRTHHADTHLLAQVYAQELKQVKGDKDIEAGTPAQGPGVSNIVRGSSPESMQTRRSSGEHLAGVPTSPERFLEKL